MTPYLSMSSVWLRAEEGHSLVEREWEGMTFVCLQFSTKKDRNRIKIVQIILRKLSNVAQDVKTNLRKLRVL